MNQPAGTYTLHQIARSVNSDKLGDDIIIFDHELRFDNEEVFPLRIDALLIVLCQQGSGRIGIDLREYEVKKNTLIVIQPKNYIFLSSHSDDFLCSTVACSNHVVEDILPKLTDILPLLIHHRTEPVSYLTDEEVNELLQYYEFLRLTLRGPRSRFLKQKVLCVLQAALYQMMEINLKNTDDDKPQRTRKEEIMARFIIAVSENFRTERQVTAYAEKLCITPKHLSSVVKEISGRTAGDWIENYDVMEAKVPLNTTHLTFQEIAVNLNFANQSFFGKYFKHHTGVSPTTYRKNNS